MSYQRLPVIILALKVRVVAGCRTTSDGNGSTQSLPRSPLSLTGGFVGKQALFVPTSLCLMFLCVPRIQGEAFCGDCVIFHVAVSVFHQAQIRFVLFVFVLL